MSYTPNPQQPETPPYAAPSQNPEVAKLLEQFQRQKETGKGSGEHPRGKAGPHDEGAAAFVIGTDPEKKIVIIDFGMSVRSVGLGAEEAMHLAELLIHGARQVATGPLTINMPADYSAVSEPARDCDRAEPRRYRVVDGQTTDGQGPDRPRVPPV